MASKSLKNALKRSREAVDLTEQPARLEPKTHAEMIAAGWKRFNVLLPPDEHEEFKITSIKLGQDMATITRELIKSWLEEKQNV